MYDKTAKVVMLKGEDAVSISNIEKKSTSGLTDTYEITLTNGTKKSFNVNNGKGIKSIAKTSTSGIVDTYTTTYNDDTTSTFTVKNGEKGDTGSVENLEVGGANILLNSNFDGTANPRENWIQWGDNVYEIINNNGVNYLHVVTSGKYQGYLQALDNSTFKNIKLANQQFTYSFIGYSPIEGETCSVFIHFRNESGWVLSQVSSEFNLKTYPSKYHFTFKVPNDENIKGINVMLGIGENSIDRNVYIGKPKLEFGEIATDWTPSLEDIEREIASAKDILNKTYPIGSIYMSVNDTDPSTLFGGTWEKIKDRFLLGADSSQYKHLCDEGNSFTLNEKSHCRFGKDGKWVEKDLEAGTYTANAETFGEIDPAPGAGKEVQIRFDAGLTGGQENLGISPSGNELNGYGLTTSDFFTNRVMVTKDYTGSNIPPYLTVYMWKRTA